MKEFNILIGKFQSLKELSCISKFLRYFKDIKIKSKVIFSNYSINFFLQENKFTFLKQLY